MENNVAFEERNSVYQVRMNEFCAFNRLNNQPSMVPGAVETTSVSQRPKCSISPINLSQTDSFLAPSIVEIPSSSSSSASPFVGPKTLYLSQLVDVNSSASYSSPFVPLAVKQQQQQQPLNKHLLAVVDQSMPKMMQFQSTPNKPDNHHLSPLDTSVIAIKSTSAAVTVAKKPNSRVNFHSIHDLATSSSSNSSSNDSSASSSILMSHDNTHNNSSGYSSFSSLIQTRLMSNSQSLDDDNKENSNEDLSKIKRKPRTSINRQQREILEYAYKTKQYPDSNEVEYLCQLLGFEENVIRIWFQNKRARAKHHHRV